MQIDDFPLVSDDPHENFLPIKFGVFNKFERIMAVRKMAFPVVCYRHGITKEFFLFARTTLQNVSFFMHDGNLYHV